MILRKNGSFRRQEFGQFEIQLFTLVYNYITNSNKRSCTFTLQKKKQNAPTKTIRENCPLFPPKAMANGKLERYRFKDRVFKTWRKLRTKYL